MKSNNEVIVAEDKAVKTPFPKIQYYSSTYNKIKRHTPKFTYGTSPWHDKGYEYYIEKRYSVKEGWSLVKETHGYTSLNKHIPSQIEFLFNGTLSECKAELKRLIEELRLNK
jgi:hypothetical protein